MELNKSNKDNFWNNHTLKNFQRLAILKDVHSNKIFSICLLKDGRIVSSSFDNNILIYNKTTFQIEIRIIEKKRINYINVNKDGILIMCSHGNYLNLYEIKGKNYKIIQVIKPYNLFFNILDKFSDFCEIQKYVELNNGNIAILIWGYAVSFYKKKKNSQEYSYLNMHNSENYRLHFTDLCELDNNQYCISLKYSGLIEFLDMNSKKIIKTIQCENFFTTDKNNQLLLMNKKDLFVIGKESIKIVDIRKKEIIKTIKVPSVGVGFIYSMHKLADNFLLVGFCENLIEQLEYDEINQEFKLISFTEKKKYNGPDLYKVSSISTFNNELIVAPYDNCLGKSSLIIYKLKK
jgi:WD40 repeat protein